MFILKAVLILRLSGFASEIKEAENCTPDYRNVQDNISED